MKRFLVFGRYGPRIFHIAQTDSRRVARSIARREYEARHAQLNHKRPGSRPRTYVAEIVEAIGEKTNDK
jgi:hypothetical protein